MNHQWQIDDKSTLSTVAYVSIGRGNGYNGQGNSEFGYSYTDWRGASYGKLTTKFRNADGTFAYDKIQEINEQSENGSMLAMSKSKTITTGMVCCRLSLLNWEKILIFMEE